MACGAHLIVVYLLYSSVSHELVRYLRFLCSFVLFNVYNISLHMYEVSVSHNMVWYVLFFSFFVLVFNVIILSCTCTCTSRLVFAFAHNILCLTSLLLACRFIVAYIDPSGYPSCWCMILCTVLFFFVMQKPKVGWCVYKSVKSNIVLLVVCLW
jgi:hypothetical protein